MKYLSSTSRNLNPANYAWESVVHQFGRPLLDSELNLSQDILRQRLDLPSGMISDQSSMNDKNRFLFYSPYTGNPRVLNPEFRANTLTIERFIASVNGMAVDVKGTNSVDPELNHVELSEPQEGIDLVDFVFLEVWRKEVTPSMDARARLKVSSPLANDTLTFQDANNSVVITAGVDFQISNSSPETARNLSEAINNYDGQGLGLTLGSVTVTSETRGTPYLFLSLTGGASGNTPTFNITSGSVGILVITQPSGGSDGEGKPNANNIYYAGNLDCHSDLYLDDDIQDPTLNVSSTRRVQIQYRLRVHANFNYSISQDIFGLDSFGLFAQGANANPINTATFSRHSNDSGLWVAGDGSEASASTLGTVDGYIYAIPVAFVYRRNKPLNGNEGFHPLDRYNTGALHDHDGSTLQANPYVDRVATTYSDRPDGLFSDQIAEEDVLDLRRRVFPKGLDFKSELVHQYHSLLDGLNKTWIAEAHNLADTGNGTAGISHTPLMCDVFGSNANSLNIGNYKRDFNNVSRRFSNVPLVERVFFIIYPGLNTSGISYTPNDNAQANGWHVGDTIVVSLNDLDAKGDTEWVPVDAFGSIGIDLPSGSKITDLGMCWHNDGHYVNDIVQDVEISYVNITDSAISVVLGENDQVANGGISGAADYAVVSDDSLTLGSEAVIFLELVIEMPSGDHGLTGRVDQIPSFDSEVYATGSCISLNEPEAVVNLYPNVGNGVASPIINLREGKREVSLEYVRGLMTRTIVSTRSSFTYLPYRVYGDPSTITITDVSDPLNPSVLTLDSSSSKFSHSEPLLAWQAVWVSGQRSLEIEFHPVVPYPATDTSNNSIFVFYKRQAPQTCGSDFPIANDNISTDSGGVVPVEMELSPLAIGEKISSFMNSDFTYPFLAPTEHLGSSPLAESNYGYDEYLVLNSNEVFLDDLTVNTGNVDLSSLVPLASSVKLTLGRSAIPPVKDNYNRVVYQTMSEASYYPASYAKNLSVFNKSYKNALPCLMKVTSDSHDLYRSGEVLLVVFIKTSIWGQSVSVDMRDNNSNNLVVACVYRTRNLLLLGD
jgi:hypothetical protein